jgi:class 3 adenylate cyclase
VVFRFLSRLQGELAGVVHAHGGVVDKFLGDGMLAVFGVGAVNEGHAGRAVAAAVALRDAVERVNAENLLPGPVRMGIGLHSGPLVCGCLGTGERLEWTVIGDTVNTASRLESLTKDQGVDLLLSGAVLVRVPALATRPLGRVQLRGREQEIEVHTLG